MARTINRREFLNSIGIMSTSLLLFNGCDFWAAPNAVSVASIPALQVPLVSESIFDYIKRIKGKMDITLYRQVVGAANDFKEGDKILGVSAANENSRKYARELLSNTTIKDLNQNSLFTDELYTLIQNSTSSSQATFVQQLTLGELKTFLLEKEEANIKAIMPDLSSDVIGCVVKLMNNDELIEVGQKVFNPLPNSKIGSKGYMSARVQPNSPTDNIEDITWQVFDAWSYGVGDLVLGNNPVSSEPASVAKIEKALFDIITTFGLENVIPNCVLSHIDVQAEVETQQPGTTGIWFQSLAGTVNANTTFDVSIDKMFRYAAQRDGQYGLYAETGQGADFTNGHAAGFDMVLHEARKYGFIRALKLKMAESKPAEKMPWVHVNDVAGFIGPEVFKTKEQLVRCCLEDTVMGKLHGLTIGLDICSTLHMDVTLEDLDWCIEQVMPANPAYLMALPTKNDPMLSYLTTAFHDHVKVREKFGYKVNDQMWAFFKKLEVIDQDGKPSEHFGDPLWVYYQYCKTKKDKRSKEAIYTEGKACIARIRERGVPIAEGYGENIWDLDPAMDKEVHTLYEDAKVSLWTEMGTSFVSAIPASVPVFTKSADRKDYVYHPHSGEELRKDSVSVLKSIRQKWNQQVPDVQIVISDGLNARALMDEGHLLTFLAHLTNSLQAKNYTVSKENLVVKYGRVRAGYLSGELLFGKEEKKNNPKGIIHIIGERPGSGHHNFSAYLTAVNTNVWHKKGVVDHNITRVVSGISDTALKPEIAVKEVVTIFDQLFRATSSLGEIDRS